jgi:alkanesulfonate monooxygenase SsuD/methylene tetrahydromethanopterin reductase-like flavin-dependent oxidoreductase (luciferase family)
VLFGLFGSAQAQRGGPSVDSGAGFREFVEMNVEAEALGYQSTFLVEHHFTGFGQVSATLNLLTWVGARTTTLRLGTAVIVLAWHNPVLLAEQAAALDLLSGGRLDFGIGKGYRRNEFQGFCVPMEEADARFDESLMLLRKAWTTDERWSYQGRFWQFENVVVEPPPAQRPHPVLWMGAGSPASIEKVAALGLNLLLDQFATLHEIGERIAIYKAAVEALGRPFDPHSVGVTRSLRIISDEAEREQAIAIRLAGRQRVAALEGTDPSGRLSVGFSANTREVAEAGALYGTPDEVAGRLERLRAMGAEYVLVAAQDGLPTLRRFAAEVMPAFLGAPRQPVAR